MLALENVDIHVDGGEVLALLGDNGAGKSTLIKCISGVHRLDSGTVEVDGEIIHMSRPAVARAAGIETVYQDLALFDNLDAAANFFAGREAASPSWLPRACGLASPLDGRRDVALVGRLKVSIPPRRHRSVFCPEANDR